MLWDSIAIVFYIAAGGTLFWAVYSAFARRRREDLEKRDPRDYPGYGPGDGAISPNHANGSSDGGGGDGGGGGGGD